MCTRSFTMTSNLDTIVIPSSSPEQTWARSVSPCTPTRLFGLPSLSPSPSLTPPSELFENFASERRNKPRSLDSPLTRDVVDTASSKMGTETENADKPPKTSIKAKRSGILKTKKSRSSKGVKSQEPLNKILKGRVAKASSVSKSDKSIDLGKLVVQDENLTHMTEPKAKKGANYEGLNLEEALKRRLDWTPPKSSSLLPCEEGSAFHNNGTKPSFSDALRDFQYNRENSLSEMLQPRIEDNPTKRRRVGLVDVEIPKDKNAYKNQQKKAPQKTRKTKVKPQKQPRTITARVTALYEPVDCSKELLSNDEALSDAGEISTKQKKRTKKSAKPNEPEYVILSPGAATKSLNNQDFLFGTCSQLERADSPIYPEDTQRSLQISDSSTSVENATEEFGMPSSTRSITTRLTGTKSHWSVAARGFDGTMVQPEIIDMTASSNISATLNRIPLVTSQEVPKAFDNCNKASNTSVGEETPSDSAAQPGTHVVSSHLTSTAVDHGMRSIVEQSTNRQPDMPNFNGNTDEELSRQIASYGFKAIRGRKKMVALLEKCWQNKHNTAKIRIETTKDHLSASGTGKASAPIAKPIVEATSRDKSSARSNKTSIAESGLKAASRVSRKKESDKPLTRKPGQFDEGSNMPAPKLIHTLDEIEEIEDSEEEIIPSPTRIRMQRENSFRQPTSAHSVLALSSENSRSLISSRLSEYENDTVLPDLLEQITKAIGLQPRPRKPISHSSRQGQQLQLTWHEKILLYDPIILEDFATWLNTEGFPLVYEDREVSAGFVRSWCESQGICCTYRS